MDGQSCIATAGCTGTIDSGYCNVCGMPDAVTAAASTPPAPVAAAAPAKDSSVMIGTTSGRSGTALSGVARGTSSSRRGSSSRSTTSRQQLGLGLLQLTALPKANPELAIMAVPVVPIKKRFCSKEGCVNNTTPMFDENQPDKARESGFCKKCGTRYNFKAALKKGEMVAGQYEVRGPIAFGGMGWIYLALDKTLDRWVVLKGLLNSDDPSLAAAAVAERQYLAAVKHPNIVGIYTFVQHQNAGYIVMEYVGGKMLKTLRKERGGPLPLAEAIAYTHRVLGAFAYLHKQGLIYCDFKPDNVMLEEDDIKLIDLGGVMKFDSTDAPVGTRGYYAPEVEQERPTVTSDLYTIARSLWVLTCETKGFVSTYQFKLPTPDQEPLFAQWPSFYKFLLKATHQNPSMRFQSADEMAVQLAGVLREVVALQNGTIKPYENANFTGDALALLDLDKRGVEQLDAESLPGLKRDPADPATQFILSNLGAADPKKQCVLFEQALGQFPTSTEAQLSLARAHILLGQHDEAETHLAAVEKQDPYEWRVIWYRGAMFLAQKQYADASAAFSTCYNELPGELAPKLALAMASELANNTAVATVLYNMVAGTDPSYATAVFGLARCYARDGKRAEAVKALDRISLTSSLHGAAQKTMALTLIESTSSQPGAAELDQAGKVIEGLALAGAEGCRLTIDLFQTAISLVGKGLKAPATLTVLGQNLTDRSLRLGLERAYRDLAKLESNPAKRNQLVDQANASRPRTLV